MDSKSALSDHDSPWAMLMRKETSGEGRSWCLVLASYGSDFIGDNFHKLDLSAGKILVLKDSVLIRRRYLWCIVRKRDGEIFVKRDYDSVKIII